MSAPSRSTRGAIPLQDCYSVGTSESGHIQVLPDDPNIVFSGAIGSSEGGGGALLRYDHRTQQQRVVTVWPELAGGVGPKDAKYRFPVDLPDLALAARPERSLLRRQHGIPIYRRRNQLGAN